MDYGYALMSNLCDGALYGFCNLINMASSTMHYYIRHCLPVIAGSRVNRDKSVQLRSLRISRKALTMFWISKANKLSGGFCVVIAT